METNFWGLLSTWSFSSGIFTGIPLFWGKCLKFGRRVTLLLENRCCPPSTLNQFCPSDKSMENANLYMLGRDIFDAGSYNLCQLCIQPPNQTACALPPKATEHVPLPSFYVWAGCGCSIPAEGLRMLHPLPAPSADPAHMLHPFHGFREQELPCHCCSRAGAGHLTHSVGETDFLLPSDLPAGTHAMWRRETPNLKAEA